MKRRFVPVVIALSLLGSFAAASQPAFVPVGRQPDGSVLNHAGAVQPADVQDVLWVSTLTDYLDPRL